MAKVKVMERSTDTKIRHHPNYFPKPKMHRMFLNDPDLLTKPNRNVSLRKIIKRMGRVTKSVKISVKQFWERYLKMIVYLVALSILLLMIIEETNTYRENPTGTAVDDDMYPVQEIDYPAIAICNINILSRQKVFNLAGELWSMEKVRRIGNVTLEKVKYLLKYMGHLYMFANWESEPGDLKLLDKILTTAYGNNYNVLKLMEDIGPECRKYFQHCGWSGEIRSCEELFIPRWTQDGVCCTFNYVRWTESFSGEGDTDVKYNIDRSEMSGFEYGLRVFLNPRFDDVYYNILPARGFKILFYSSSDYPDAPSGGLKEILVGPGTENFLLIKGTSFYSSPDVIQYDKKKRHCMFNTEQRGDFAGTYSYSQCMMLCRTRDIVKKCGCVPFFYPYPIEFVNSKDCNIMDLPCLKRNRHKWWSIKPVYDKSKDLWDPSDMEKEQPACNCLPSCDTVDYSIFKTGSTIRHHDVGLIDFVRNYNRDNVSQDTVLLTMSFEGATIVRFRQDVLYYWYDLLSVYGGLCSMFLGLSILTPIELIYLFCLRVWKIWKNRKNRQNTTKSSGDLPAIVESSKLNEQVLYWKEIIPNKKKILKR